jgi:hypothetical protein
MNGDKASEIKYNIEDRIATNISQKKNVIHKNNYVGNYKITFILSGSIKICKLYY